MKRSPHGLALVLLAVIFVSLNVFSNLSLRAARLDLTQNNLFTLSQGTLNILARVEEPVTLKFYYSQDIAADQPKVQIFAQRVRDMLEEMATHADGRLLLEIIDPEPFSENEDQAVAQGLVARPIQDGDVIYFGLVGTNRVDSLEVIPYFADERQQYLEYDLARLIHNLSQPKKPVLGVISNLPLDTGAGGMMAAMRGQSQPFLIYAELTDRFEVEFIGLDTIKIPKRVDVLLLAHPRPPSDLQAYAIDQFVMRGGRVIAFVDPQSEVSLTAGPNGEPLRGYTQQSNLARLMQQWGVVMDDKVILADRKRAQRVSAGRDARRALTDYILWMGYGAEEMNADDPVTANIDRLNLGTVGVLRATENATTAMVTLLRSSDEAGLMTRDYVLSAPTPDALQRRFVPGEAPYTIAARLSGQVRTAFAEGPPETGNKKGERAKTRDHLAQNDNANIIVFADTDFFDDRFWVSEQNYLGQRFGVPIADNGKFLLNAVENLMGSDDLISLRGRERVARPFTRVEDLRRAAEKSYLDEEENLIARIEVAQKELDQLEKTGATLGDAQAAAKTHRAELLSARKSLRRVQGDLRRDIEVLESWVTWINIIAVPLLVGLAALGLAYRQRRRRLATQKAGGLIVEKQGAE
ncbi:MAG: ABC transporter [Rhodobiaceae bacterium]|nr:ABC transporter [Rhodobiaceae bacterium]